MAFQNAIFCFIVSFVNQLCVLPIRLTEDELSVQKDATSWHVVRASLLTIRRYLDISLLLWIDTIDSTLAGIFDEPPRVVAAAGNRVSSPCLLHRLAFRSTN